MPFLIRHPTPDGQSEYIDAEEAVEAYQTAIANRDSARCQTEHDIFQQQANAILAEWAAYRATSPIGQLAKSGLHDPEILRRISSDQRGIDDRG